MEALLRRLAGKITDGASLDGEKKEVAIYGLLALMQMASIMFIILVVGIIFGFWREALIIFFAVGFLRRSTGGHHSASMTSCTIMSSAVIIILSLICRLLFTANGDVFFFVIEKAVIYFLCGIIIYLKVPLDNPNKPIKKPEKIRRLRIQSFVTLLVFILLSTIFFLFREKFAWAFSVSLAIDMAVIWQTFTLTKPSAIFISFTDKLFGREENSK